MRSGLGKQALGLCLAAGLAVGSSAGDARAEAEMAGAAKGSPADVVLELNRIEPRDQACRLYLLLRNSRPEGFERLTLDLVFFDRKAIIDRRFSVEAGPLPGDKTSLKQLDVPELSCDALGSLLLNDVTACDGSSEGASDSASDSGSDCISLVGLENRTDILFFK